MIGTNKCKQVSFLCPQALKAVQIIRRLQNDAFPSNGAGLFDLK